MSWHMRTRRFALTLLIVGCTHELNFFSPLMLKSEWQTPAEPSDCHQLLELPTNTRSWNPSMDAASGLRKSLQAYFRPQDIGTREMKATFKSAQDALQRYHRKHRSFPREHPSTAGAFRACFMHSCCWKVTSSESGGTSGSDRTCPWQC